MVSDGSPPSWWYEPPEPRHSNGKIIPENCGCAECHEHHIEEGQVVENWEFGEPECCVDQMEEWFETGHKCRKHPKEYAEPGMCEGCDDEKLEQKNVPINVPPKASSE